MFYYEIVEDQKIKKTLSNNCFLATVEKYSHKKWLCNIGCFFPKTKAQIKFFLKTSVYFDVLGFGDIVKIESLLNKYGKKGDYIYTKSKKFMRIRNMNDVFICFRENLKSEV